MFEKLKKSLSDEITFSFGKVNKNFSKTVEIDIKIFFGDSLLETTLFKTEELTYIAMERENYERGKQFYSLINKKLSSEESNREIIDRCLDFDMICENLLALLATEEFKKTRNYKMQCIYDPSFKKIFEKLA